MEIGSGYNFNNAHDWIIGAREDGTQHWIDATIDEVCIFNRTLTWEQINASYSASSYYSNNFTSLSNQTYSYYAYAIDEAGNHNQTETRDIIIKECIPPDPDPPHSNLSDLSQYWYNIFDNPITITLLDSNDGDEWC